MISGLHVQTLGSVPAELRVDVDGNYPQNKASLSFGTGCPAHWIADLAKVNDVIWRGPIWYRKDNANTLLVDASGNLGGAGNLPDTMELQYGGYYAAGNFYYWYAILRHAGSGYQWYYYFTKTSDFFRTVTVETDSEAGIVPIASLNPWSVDAHHPANLANENITVASTYAKAGVQISNTAGASTVATSLAGGDARWTDAELHDAMQGAWSKQEGSAWNMWVFQANRHINDMTGIMFDSIGTYQRCGTALFHGQSSYTGADVNLVNRHKFVTLIHEMGHTFNNFHSWLKTSGTSTWCNRVANEPEARSYMNYPDRVAAGYYGFFDTFEYRFSDQELLFMRHAPESFVRMGGSTWGTDHGGSSFDTGLSSGVKVEDVGDFRLSVSGSEGRSSFEFLEPVYLQLTLTNGGAEPRELSETTLEDIAHMQISVSRNGGPARVHKPYSTPCAKQDPKLSLQAGESMQGSLLLSASLTGWLVAEPGTYTVVVAVHTPCRDGQEDVASASFTFTVEEGEQLDRKGRRERELLAQDYFRDDVGRALAFGGTQRMIAANETLEDLAARLPGAAAAVHAELTLALPRMREFKLFERNADGSKAISGRAADPRAVDTVKKLLVDRVDHTVKTLGHTSFAKLAVNVADAMRGRGNDSGADALIEHMNDTVSKRGAKVPSFIARRGAKSS